jgi:hypothetical protein
MDGLKVGEIKSPHAGHKSALMCTTQIKIERLKKRQIDKRIKLDSKKRKNVHKNEGIKELQ